MPTPPPLPAPTLSALLELAAEPGAWVEDSTWLCVYGTRTDRSCGSTAPSTGDRATLLGFCFFLASRWRRVQKCNPEDKSECELQLPQLPLDHRFNRVKFPVKTKDGLWAGLSQ